MTKQRVAIGLAAFLLGSIAAMFLADQLPKDGEATGILVCEGTGQSHFWWSVQPFILPCSRRLYIVAMFDQNI